MTMVLWKSDGDYYLLSYEHFNLAFVVVFGQKWLYLGKVVLFG